MPKLSVKPYWQSDCGRYALYCGDNLSILPSIRRVDAVITDPPYGVKKAVWDDKFPTEWYSLVRDKAETIYVMVGQSTIPFCISMMGGDYRDVMACWLSNGMTLGPLGFGNWIPIIVGQKVKRFLGGQNAFKIVVNTTEKIDHPSPKPLDAMMQLVGNREHQVILDPFAGSGTTGIACIRLSREFIGIEKEEKYCRIAAKRMRQELFDWKSLKVTAPDTEVII